MSVVAVVVTAFGVVVAVVGIVGVVTMVTIVTVVIAMPLLLAVGVLAINQSDESYGHFVIS